MTPTQNNATPAPSEGAMKAHAEKLASVLAEAAGYLASVRTDRRLKDQFGYAFVGQTEDWAEGAKEISAKANALLDEHDQFVQADRHTSAPALLEALKDKARLDYLSGLNSFAVWFGKYSALTNREGETIAEISDLGDAESQLGNGIACGKNLRAAIDAALCAQSKDGGR